MTATPGLHKQSCAELWDVCFLTPDDRLVCVYSTNNDAPNTQTENTLAVKFTPVLECFYLLTDTSGCESPYSILDPWFFLQTYSRLINTIANIICLSVCSLSSQNVTILSFSSLYKVGYIICLYLYITLSTYIQYSHVKQYINTV